MTIDAEYILLVLIIKADSRRAPSQRETALQVTPSLIGWAQT